MREFKDVLKGLREEKMLSQKELAEELGLGYSTIGMYENGSRMPKYDILDHLADYFNVDMDYLLGKTSIRNKYRECINNSDFLYLDNIYKVNKVKFPMLGTIACGEPIYADEQRESYVMAGTEIHADFCLKCKGDSMINARIYDGDIVFIRKQEIVNNGEIAAVIIDNEATLKRFYYFKEANVVILKAENPKYKDLEYKGEQLNQIRVIGKAVAFQGDVI